MLACSADRSLVAPRATGGSAHYPALRIHSVKGDFCDVDTWQRSSTVLCTMTTAGTEEPAHSLFEWVQQHVRKSDTNALPSDLEGDASPATLEPRSEGLVALSAGVKMCLRQICVCATESA